MEAQLGDMLKELREESCAFALVLLGFFFFWNFITELVMILNHRT